MERFSEVVESARVPLDIPLRPYLNDHCFKAQAVWPAVEAMEALAQAARRFRPAIDVTCMTEVAFDKFLFLDPGVEHLSAVISFSAFANGDVAAALTTHVRSKHALMARVKTHATLRWPHHTQPLPELPLDVACAPEGVCLSVEREKIYPELVSFGPFYRNVAALHLTPRGAVAEIRTPAADAAGAQSSNLLGSPFALDAAFHAACVWGQRFTGIVAFPVAVDRRRVYLPTRPVETYFVHVTPVQPDRSLLIFDLRVYDREGRLHEACWGVRMRDVSGGTIRPPEWISAGGRPGGAVRVTDACRAVAVIEPSAMAAFAEKTLSKAERQRYTGMNSRRRRSYLAARLACKRISRQLSGHDTQTAPEDITTIGAERPHLPCCPLTDGRSPYWCSVAHDDQFAVAVASDRRVGVDVEKLSQRLLKFRSLYMSEPEQTLVAESPLAGIETAVRIWSIKEAVAKAHDCTLAEAWQRVQVCEVGVWESRFRIDGQGLHTAVHDAVGPHVFTLV